MDHARAIWLIRLPSIELTHITMNPELAPSKWFLRRVVRACAVEIEDWQPTRYPTRTPLTQKRRTESRGLKYEEAAFQFRARRKFANYVELTVLQQISSSLCPMRSYRDDGRDRSNRSSGCPR
jgi:hypothetical protein